MNRLSPTRQPITRCAIKWSIPIICLAAAGSGAFAQQYPILPVPGSPKNVLAVIQDSLGRLWLAGQETACFDGTRFFYLRDYGFPAVESHDITEDPSGGIWIGAETGVYRFANGRVQELAKGVAVGVFAPTPDIAIAAMGPLGGGLPANAQLVRIRRNGTIWIPETIMSLDSSGPLTLDHTGRLLYSAPGGWSEIAVADVMEWKPGAHLRVDRHPIADSKIHGAGPMRVVRDRYGCVWFASDAHTLYSCGEDRWHSAPYPDIEVRTGVGELPNGEMLLVGNNLLAVGRPGSFRIAKPANGLPLIHTAQPAWDGTIWLGGPQGLYRFASPFQMEYWTARDGVDIPWAIRRSGRDIYAGLDHSLGVLSKDRQRWQAFDAFPKVGRVAGLLPTSDGNILAALNPGGAVLMRPNGTILARTHGPPGDYGLRLSKIPSGQVWLGGGGLGTLTRDGPSLDLKAHPLQTRPSGNVLDIQYEDHTRKLWACYNGGLVVMSFEGNWREITTRDGLLMNACWSLAALPNGDVWYGYYNTPAFARLHPLTDGRFSVKEFRGNDDVHDPESLTLDLDRRGWLWRGGIHGLSVATQADAETGKWIYLDQASGLPGQEVNIGSYFEDLDGSVWMGIDINVFHFKPPPDLVAPQFAPRLFVSAFSSQNQSPRLAEAVSSLPHGSKVTAHIGSLQFDRRNALRVRYRVLPEQSGWKESSSLDLSLGALSSGRHMLEVQGRVFTGPWSPTLSRSLIILRPIWLSWPALTGFALAGAGVGAIGLRWRERRAARDRARLPDLKALRVEVFAPEVHDVLGTVLDGRYEVGEILASGGFATVLGGRDLQQGSERCAVKVFRPELGDDEWMAHRFQQEVSALEQIHHPNVVRIYGHGITAGGAPYLVMEFVDGKTLRDAMREPRMPASSIARLLRQAGSALDQIHAHKIYHRDLKPENIMLRSDSSPDQELVIIDFSIAIVKDPDKSVQGISRAAGSIIYMAPENAFGYAEASTDIHSLGKILIELLTGQPLVELLPHASIDLPSRVREVLADPSFGLSEPSLELMCSAMEFHPRSRPKSAGQFADQIATDLEISSLPPGP